MRAWIRSVITGLLLWRVLLLSLLYKRDLELELAFNRAVAPALPNSPTSPPLDAIKGEASLDNTVLISSTSSSPSAGVSAAASAATALVFIN
jgi:hypothetical protein